MHPQVRREVAGTLLVALLVTALGAAAGPALASHVSNIYRSPVDTPNDNRLLPDGFNPTIAGNPSRDGRATMVFADRTHSKWEVAQGLFNVQGYAPNSLDLTVVSGSGCASNNKGTVQTPTNGRCVNSEGMYWEQAPYKAASCGPGCDFGHDTYYSNRVTASNEWRVVYNDYYSGSYASSGIGSMGGENTSAHEMAHQLGMGHHAAQELANGRWYPGVLGEWGEELVCWQNYEDTHSCNSGGGDKYRDDRDRHVLNAYEKDRINQAWGYSTQP